ncbi:alpha/beta fold hydrolase [Nonomuraea longicatena]|uniref:3-oxoadipate enol-lactonase n=1 Tax=Nonomuraea longicatena TaxID=83682 RepID=A0ABP3Z9J7_9ACTN
MSASTLTRIVRGEGPGLLLAHGAGGGALPNYGTVLDGLARHHRVVAPDYPGSGSTPRATAPLSLDALADELVATAVEEGLERFAMAGYSLGVPTAIRAAVRHPDRVTALVLTAGFARLNPRMLLALRVWRDLLGDPDRLAAFMALIAVGAPTLDAMGQDELDRALAESAAGVPPGTADHIDLAEGIDVRADLTRIEVPTLVVSTVYDVLATPAHHREVAAGIPGARLAELPTGHLPFAEAPAEWLALMRDFLAAL